MGSLRFKRYGGGRRKKAFFPCFRRCVGCALRVAKHTVAGIRTGDVAIAGAGWLVRPRAHRLESWADLAARWESAIARRPTLISQLGWFVGWARSWESPGGPGAELLVADCACPLYLLRFWSISSCSGGRGLGIAPILVLFRAYVRPGRGAFDSKAARLLCENRLNTSIRKKRPKSRFLDRRRGAPLRAGWVCDCFSYVSDKVYG